MDFTPEQEKILEPLRLAVKEQGDLIRSMKEQKMNKVEIQGAVVELRARKKALEEKEKEFTPVSLEEQFNRAGLEDLCKRRFIYGQSFMIYGGVGGLYDFGPVGCSIKANIISFWRQHFVLEEQMLEIDSSIMTPENVLKASGHVERFSDFMCRDLVTNEYYRADHLIEAHMKKLKAEFRGGDRSVLEEYQSVMDKMDGYTRDELTALIHKYNVVIPESGNPVSELSDFNLMFSTSIGPAGNQKGFLRPETAQGIFVNFKRLLEYNNGRVPFAAAQIGKAFRNEIHPQSGLVRLREFEMAEIEHFFHPSKTDCPKFEYVRNIEVSLYSAENQMSGKGAIRCTLGDAVASGLIENEILAYFLGRIFLFMTGVGINPEFMRFRQHMCTEMAHYAKDCWDCECLISYGWLECVGCANRSCFDLEQHAKGSKNDMFAKEDLKTPEIHNLVEAVPNKGILGKTFKKDASIICSHLASLSNKQTEELESEINSNGKVQIAAEEGRTFELTKDMVTIRRSQKKVFEKDFIPSVIEPSFGIGRILYAALEHTYRVREGGDEQRAFLSLPAAVCALKCSILPLSNKKEFQPFIDEIRKTMSAVGLGYKIDDSSSSIGRRYARTDEIGIPYGITVDFDTVQQRTVTVRERDSTEQVRVHIEDAAQLVKDLCEGRENWANVKSKYGLFQGQESL
eukprot:Nk52_evm44s1485 gene=Nk52_evmTU44s1485